ncbi:MucR family transcriptional regulator [Mesorhizobium sp. B1-1-8]|uniref:MucR family transcriptional regulator n=1 Tax=Mesorhizobium sp. B1-1-8 TaxID=2589976 RepID=UPI00112736B7|nr:MucR family transcriptional regulator [Mesorhizobium sp. B1-1-8]UCI10540.1 MucR family transcriptional regulator [Mesorhizobium sp. B1-1-8]
MPAQDETNIEIISLTADIVSAYVSKNPLPAANLPDLIASIHSSLTGIKGPTVVEQPPLVPAVNPKRSVTPDYIISLEDGRKFKMMKRYLGLLGLTPDEYRAKWGLPRDYPMVAPNYATARSALAKSIGLGRKPTEKPVKKGAVRRKAKG